MAADAVRKDGADPHIVAAFTDAERELGDLHRRLALGSYSAVPTDASLKLAV